MIKSSQVRDVSRDSQAVGHVLLIQKDCRSANALDAQLRAQRDLVFQVECVQDVEAATERLSRQTPDAVLLDLDLPGSYDLDALITLHLHAPQVPILVFAETMDLERGRRAVHAGAQSFLTRHEIEAPLIARELVFAIERHALRSATHSHRAQLQFSEARFRLLINENADGIVVVNTLGAIRFVNPAAEALFGKTRQELLGAMFRAPLEQPTMAVIEIARGREKILAQQQVVKTMWDHEDAYVATLRDVTAQQRAADALRARAGYYREFIESSSEGIWRCRLAAPLSIHLPVEDQVRAIFDAAYIEECNPALARLYGFQSPQELVGRALSENMRRDEAVNLETYREFVRQQYRLNEGETHETDRLGNPKIFRTNLYGIVENDALVGIWGTLRDVTAERANMAEIQTAKKAAVHHQRIAQALADSAAALNSTLSFERVLDRILENVGRVVPHDAASIFLIEGDEVRIARARGFEERGLGKLLTDWRLPLTNLVSLKQMRETREALVIPDTRADPYWVNLSFEWIASYVGAPMCVRDEVIGFLNVDSSIPNFYDETHAAALKSFADQAATALDNARLHAQVKKRAEEWAQVYDLVRELGMQLDVSLMLETLVKRVTELVHAPCGSVSLYLPETQELEVQYIVGEPESLLGARFKLGQGVVGRVAQTRQPLIVEDYRTFEHRLPEALERQIAAVLSVPMLFGGEVEGVLTVRERGDSTRRFTQDDAQLLTLIAAQAAALIHNARLHQETEKRAQQLALVYDAGLTLNRVLEPRTQLDFLLRIAMRSVRADRAIFFRYEPAASELVVDLELGFDTAEKPYGYKRRVPLTAAPGIEAWVARERVPALLPDTARDARFARSSDRLGSGIWVPVEHDENLLGVLAVASDKAHAFSSDDERLLVWYASQAAVALENARLYQSVLRENERRTIMHQASQEVISAGLDAERVYAAIHRAVSRLMPCEAFGLALLDEQEEQILLPYLYDRGGRQHVGAIPKSRGLSGHVIRTGKSLIIDNLAKSEIESINHGYPIQVVSVLAVPMRHGGQVIGALLAESYEEKAYDDADRVRLEMLAAYAAAACMNVRGYENLRRALERKS